MRKWRRLVAHNKMRKAGLSRVNKVTGDKSYFAKNWRDFA